MSYILGALKKAERERKREREDGEYAEVDWNSNAWDSPNVKSNQNIWFRYALVAAVLLFLAVLYLLWVLANNNSPNSVVAIDSAAVNKIPEKQFQAPVEISDNVIVPIDHSVTAQVSAEAPVSAGSPNLPNITGHLYVSDDESLSRIFSDKGFYRVGHVFEDGLVLESISQSQATFEWEGESYQISFN